MPLLKWSESCSVVVAAFDADDKYLRETIEGFERRLDQHSDVSTSLANFLMEWVLQHLLKEDKACGAFLNRAGVY